MNKKPYVIDRIIGENGFPTNRGVGWFEDGAAVVIVCSRCEGEGTSISSCPECGSDQKETCGDCGGSGYTETISNENWTEDELKKALDMAAEFALKQAVEIRIAQKPKPLENFAGDKALLLERLLNLGRAFVKDVLVVRWPWAIREQVFKHFIESLFDNLGNGSPPKEFYGTVLLQLTAELKPADDGVPRKNEAKIKKKGKNVGSEENSESENNKDPNYNLTLDDLDDL